MIFKTIEDDLGKTKFGINDSFKGLFNGSFFKGEKLLSDNDIRALQAYNAEIERGVSPMTAYYRTMQDASDAAVNMAQSAGEGTVQINNMTKASKAAKIGMKALATVGNMFLGMAISFAITKLFEGLDYIIHAEEKLQDKLEESRNSLNNVTSEIESLNSELDTTKNRINELNSLDNLSLTEEQELEQLKLKNQELERELRLKQEIEKQNQKEVNDNARKYFGKGTSNNKYSQFDSINNFEKDIETVQTIKNDLNEAKQKYNDLLEKSSRTELTGDESILFNDLEYIIKDLEQSYNRYSDELASTYTKFTEQDDNITDSELLNDLNEAYDAYDKLLDKAGWTERKLSEILSEGRFSNDRLELLDLASDGALSIELIENEYSNVLKEVEALGISVEDFYQYIISESRNVAKAIEEIADVKWTYTETITQLDEIKSKMDVLDASYSKLFKDDEQIGFEDFSSILEAFGEVENIDEYIEKIRQAGQDTEAVDSAIEELITAYIKHNGILDNVTEENAELINQTLTELGITNSYELVIERLNHEQQVLAANKALVAKYGEELENVTADEIEEFVNEREETDLVRIELEKMILSKITANGTKLSFRDDLIALQGYVTALGEASYALDMMNKIKNNPEAYAQMSTSVIEDIEEQALISIQNALNNADEEVKWKAGIDIEYDGGSATKSIKDANSSAKDTAKTFDWIETLISRIQRNITNLGKLVSATYRNWSTRNNALAQEMAEVNKEINAQMTAYNAYMEKANSIGLSDYYKNLVMNGGLKIEDIGNEALREQIESFQEYYEKALNASDAIEDLRANLAELAMTKFNNVSEQYDEQISLITHNVSMLEGFVSQSEAAGYMASEVYYKAMADKQQENIAQLQGEYSSLLSAFDEAVKNGSIQKYSEEWYNMLSSINDVELELQSATTQLIEFNQTLQQLSWEVFDRIRESVSDIITEIEFLIDVLDSKDLHTDKGAITDEGLAVQGLHAVNYNTYMEQALAYAEEMRKIEAEMANDPYDMELVDRRNELLELQQEAIQGAMDEKSAIHSLWEDGYNKMLESLDKLISKRKEAMRSIKDLYDYEQSISEKTNTVASLNKQLESYKNDTSESGRALIQKITVERDKALKDLEQTEWEKQIEESEKLLDAFYSDTEEFVSQRLDNIDGLISESIDATNKNAETISNTIKETANSYGYEISDQMETIWDSANDVVCTYGDILKGTNENIANNITTGTTNVVTAINGLNGSMQTMIGKLNEIATANKESIAKTQNAVTSGQNNSYPTNNSAGNATISGGITSNTGNPTPQSQPKYEAKIGNHQVGRSYSSYEEAKKAIDEEIEKRIQFAIKEAIKGKEKDASAIAQSIRAGLGAQLYNQMSIEEIEEYASGTPHAKKGWAVIGEEGNEIIIDKDGNAVLTLAPQLLNLKGGEQVINGKETSELLTSNLMPLSAEQLWGNIVKTPKLPEMSKGVGGNVTYDVDKVELVLPNVKDYDSLVTEMQHDKRFERIVQSMTTDRLAGKGSLSKYKF